jgi:NADPH:quinone reductase-like Zn-dependent oxidoreductase
MKASVMTAYGGPEVMKYQDMPDPSPGAGEVLVKVAGIGINPEDMLERNGDLKDRYPLRFPAIIGLDETIALDDPAAFAAIPQVDVVANALRGKTATDLLAKVKDGGTFASVTGEPDGTKDYPKVRVVSFRSKQDRAGIASIADAITSGKMTIPIGRREELRNAGAAQAAFTKGGVGKVLLIP